MQQNPNNGYKHLVNHSFKLGKQILLIGLPYNKTARDDSRKATS